MKRILPILLSLLLLTGCGGNSADGYQQITQEEAKEMMDHPGCAGAGRVRQRPHPRRGPAAGGEHRRGYRR